MRRPLAARAPALRRIVLVMLLWHPGVAQALSIELTPPDQSVGVGAPVSVDLVVRSPGGAVVGGYDVVVAFDPAVLALAAVDFGPALGGPADSIQTFVAATSQLELVEVSLLGSPPQDGASDVTLATLRFDALAPGLSALTLTPGSNPASDFLADQAGFALLPSTVVSAQVLVTAAEPVAVSAVSSLLIALAASSRGQKCRKEGSR